MALAASALLYMNAKAVAGVLAIDSIVSWFTEFESPTAMMRVPALRISDASATAAGSPPRRVCARIRGKARGHTWRCGADICVQTGTHRTAVAQQEYNTPFTRARGVRKDLLRQLQAANCARVAARWAPRNNSRCELADV